MSQVNSIPCTSVQNVTTNPVQRQLPASATTQAPLSSDNLELSGANSVMQALQSTTDVRAGKIALIREQIQNGSYDADGSKLDATLDKVLDQINGQS